MSTRFLRIFALLLVLGGTFAGVARALDFDDDDPDPVRIEVGEILNYKIGTHAGCLPHRVVITGGTLPPGLTLTQVDDHTALVAGVPTDQGQWNVWMAVKDCENKSAEALFSFEISHRSYAILTQSLPAAVAGSPYEAKLVAGDHPTRFAEWKITAGSLPAGLSINPNDGVISGTPTATGASTFTVTVTGNGDDGNLRTDSKQFTINVATAIAVSSTVRPAEVGVPVRSSLAATGGTPPFTWTATGLPAGVSVASSGALTGVPRQAGSFPISAHLVDATGATKDASVTLVVKPRLAITAKRLPAARVGHAYKAKVATRGGVAGFRWSLASGKLPRGLKLGASTGTIAGKAAGGGSYRITVRVRDSLGASSTKKLVLSVR
jgi:hypothetical protein